MIKNTQIGGSVTVSRHINAGGNAVVNGSMHVGHGLRVDGWLDAPNVKRDSKGLFATAEQLTAAYPFPEPGWWALVGTSLPAELYMALDGRWQPTGSQAGELTVDTPSLTAMAERLDDATAEAKAAAAAVSSVVATVTDTAAEALDTADDARLAASGAGIMPFNGVWQGRPGSRPQRGVWFVNASVNQPARFIYIDSEYGMGESDYNDSDALEGESPVRTDCLFRSANRLWRFDGNTLVALADAPEQLESAKQFQTISELGLVQAGRLYCVTDPASHRVTDLYIGA